MSLIEARATLDHHSETHTHTVRNVADNSDSVRIANVTATGIVMCSEHPQYMISRRWLFGYVRKEKCPLCDLALQALSSSQECQSPSEISEPFEEDRVISELDDFAQSLALPVEEPECDMSTFPFVRLDIYQRQDARVAYENSMQDVAEKCIEKWRKGRTTKSSAVDPLREALVNAGLQRTNNAILLAVSFVDDFLDHTECSYVDMRVAERNYLWTLAEEKKEKLLAIQNAVPEFSSDRLDPAEANFDGSSDELRLMCQANVLLEGLILQVSFLVNKVTNLETANKGLVGQVTNLADQVTNLDSANKIMSEKIVRIELITCDKYSSKTEGVSCDKAREAGYSCTQAREAGYSCTEAREAGYSCTEAREAYGVSCTEAREAGYSCTEAREAGYSCTEAREAYGVSCTEAREAGYSCTDAREAGYSCTEAREAGYACKITFTNCSSAILTDESLVRKLAGNFDPARNVTLSLLVNNDKGHTAAIFDAAVKGRSKVLILIKSTLGHVFGGYVADSFGGTPTGWQKGSDANFLFAMGNITRNPLKLLSDSSENHLSSCGLHLGRGDLVAFCSHTCIPSKDNGYTKMETGFNALSAEITSGALCGTPGVETYTPSCMEVYAITFA